MRNGKRIAAVQSCYIPWKGYFDLINSVDEFILYDDVQYTKRDWRNRNRIKTTTGLRWLTIPVQVKGKYTQKIREARVHDPGWGLRHSTALERSYRPAPHFAEIRGWLLPLFETQRYEFLSHVNHAFIAEICRFLGITTEISSSASYQIPDGPPTQKLLALCTQTGATEYLSGPRAKPYLDSHLLESHGIQVQFMDYSGYPPYDQLYPPFEHAVTILDLLFHTGTRAPLYMKSFS